MHPSLCHMSRDLPFDDGEQDQADEYTRKIEWEKRRVAELDMEIKEMQNAISEQRKKMGGSMAQGENDVQIQRQVKVLEDRLEKAQQRQNEVEAHNRKLRQSIDDLRRERLTHDEVYRKLEKELEDKKRDMGRIIESSNRSYEARDNALAEMASLKSQAEREEQAFVSEWRELGRLIEHDRRVKDVIRSKRKGTPHSLRPHSSLSHSLQGEEESPSEHLLPEEEGEEGAWEEKDEEGESKLRKKSIEGAETKNDKSQNIEERVRWYMDALERIKEATGVERIPDLVDAFQRAEEENYQLFQQIDELNHEVARVEEDSNELRREIERHREAGVGESERHNAMGDLESKLDAARRRADAYDRKHAAALRAVNNLRTGVARILERIGFPEGDTPSEPDPEGVTEHNIMRHLGLIEQRTNELLHQHAVSRAIADGRDPSSAHESTMAPGPAVPPGSTSFSVKPPSSFAEDDADILDEEREERPLTREELLDLARRSPSLALDANQARASSSLAGSRRGRRSNL